VEGIPAAGAPLTWPDRVAVGDREHPTPILSGCPRPDGPERYGSWQTIDRVFRRWQLGGDPHRSAVSRSRGRVDRLDGAVDPTFAGTRRHVAGARRHAEAQVPPPVAETADHALRLSWAASRPRRARSPSSRTKAATVFSPSAGRPRAGPRRSGRHRAATTDGGRSCGRSVDAPGGTAGGGGAVYRRAEPRRAAPNARQAMVCRPSRRSLPAAMGTATATGSPHRRPRGPPDVGAVHAASAARRSPGASAPARPGRPRWTTPHRRRGSSPRLRPDPARPR